MNNILLIHVKVNVKSPENVNVMLFKHIEFPRTHKLSEVTEISVWRPQ